MTSRSSSPSSSLAAGSSEPAPMEDHEGENPKEATTVQEKIDNSSDDSDEEEGVETALLSTDPTETAYSKPGRRRRTFGSTASPSVATTKKDNSSDININKEADDPTFSQMAKAVNDDNDDGSGNDIEEANNDSKSSKPAWDLDDDEEEDAAADSDDDELMPESQDTIASDDTSALPTKKMAAMDVDDDNADVVEIGEKDTTAAANNDDNSDEEDQEANEVETEETEAPQDDEKENLAEKTTAKTDVNDEKSSAPAPPTATKKKAQPNEDDLVLSVDNLFCEADKETVTIKDIVSALEVEYGVKLNKVRKKIVRARLTDLIQGTVQPTVGDAQPEAEEASESEEEDVEVVGDEDSSSEESSDEEQEDPGSEYEDDEEGRLAKERKTKAAAKTKANKSNKKNSKATGSGKSRRKSLRKPNTKKASIHAHAEKLRQKRMQELRVRNEEMQLQQSEEDQKRAELIAAKFETNTDEKRWQRLEDRLDLLQKLDQKRLHIIELDDIPLKQLQRLEQEKAAKAAAIAKVIQDKIDLEKGEESDSDDDMELEIIGGGDNRKPLFPSVMQKSTALSVLDLADVASPLAKKNPKHRKNFLENLTSNNNLKQKQVSPSRNVNARAMLRSNLLKKQRKMGNMWLARELGYKNEQEHLRDCVEAEKKKRDIVLQRESQRLAANERTQLRERLRESVYDEEDEEAELEIGDPLDANANATAGDDDDDEEMVLAKQVEQEEKEDAASPAVVEASDDHPADNAEKTADDDASVKDMGAPIEASTTPVEDTRQSLPTEKGNAEAINKSDDAGAEKLSQDGEKEDATDSAPASDDDFPVPDDSQDDSQHERFPDAQSDLVTADITMTLGGHMDLTLKSQVEDKLEIGTGSQEMSTKDAATADDDDVETQKFETQAPFAAPLTAVVTADSDTNTTSVSTADISPEKSDGEAKKASPGNGDDIVDTDDEQEFDDTEEPAEAPAKKVEKKDRNAAWKAMLESEAKKLKKGKGKNEFLETEADEEEEEEVAGLEDFGFSVQKKANKGDDDDMGDDEINADDLKHVVDDVSDDEGDEETGEKMRVAMAQKEEKERHKDMLRRMREGYDGRRGGIAGGGTGARGMHRFDQLVAADNRADAERLGLLNEDEMDSDAEENGDKKDVDDEEDEAALLDKMLKDRFLHRSSVEMEEHFSDDDEDDENKAEATENKAAEDDQEQEHLAKRFAKRARMERLMEEYGKNDEFSHSRLIEEDTTMKDELKHMKNGLTRKRGSAALSRTSSIVTESSQHTDEQSALKRQKPTASVFGGGLLAKSGSLSLALQKSGRQHTKSRTSFLGNSQSSTNGSQDPGISSQKSISFSHVVFQSCGGDSQLSSRGASQSQSRKGFGTAGGGLPRSRLGGRKASGASRNSSLWSNVMAKGPKRKR